MPEMTSLQSDLARVRELDAKVVTACTACKEAGEAKISRRNITFTGRTKLTPKQLAAAAAMAEYVEVAQPLLTALEAELRAAGEEHDRAIGGLELLLMAIKAGDPTQELALRIADIRSALHLSGNRIRELLGE